MTRFTFPLVTFIFAGLSVSALTAQQPSSQQPSPRPEFSFVGTVIRLNATSVEGVPPSALTAVVRVDEILQKPSAVTLGRQQEITVLMRNNLELRLNQRYQIDAVGVVYSTSIAVKPVNVRHLTATAAVFIPKIDPDGSARDKTLMDRAMTSDLVVVGKVTSVREPTMQPQGVRISEHEANWREAIIEVEDVLKGTPMESVVVRFPSSQDIRWYTAPAFRRGQEGTFFLQLDRVSGTPQALYGGNSVNAFTALRPEDVAAKEVGPKLKTALKQ